MTRTLLGGTLLLFALVGMEYFQPHSAWANTLDAALEACLKAHTSARDVIDCAATARIAWEEKEAHLLAELNAATSERIRPLLAASQQAFRAFLEKEAVLPSLLYQAHLDGGDLWRTAEPLRTVELVRWRTLDLQGLLDQMRGNYGLPPFDPALTASRREESAQRLAKMRERISALLPGELHPHVDEAVRAYELFREAQITFLAALCGFEGDLVFRAHWEASLDGWWSASLASYLEKLGESTP